MEYESLLRYWNGFGRLLKPQVYARLKGKLEKLLALTANRSLDRLLASYRLCVVEVDGGLVTDSCFSMLIYEDRVIELYMPLLYELDKYIASSRCFGQHNLAREMATAHELCHYLDFAYFFHHDYLEMETLAHLFVKYFLKIDMEPWTLAHDFINSLSNR